jgi:hypothetical protein
LRSFSLLTAQRSRRKFQGRDLAVLILEREAIRLQVNNQMDLQFYSNVVEEEVSYNRKH